MEEGRRRPSKTHLRRRRRPPEALFFLQPQPQTLLFIILIIFVDSCLASTFSDDLSVMQKMATSISPTGWKGSDPCGDSWPGVSCNGNRVIQISLSGMSLSGTLPTDLNKLTKITKVYLQNNQLSGSVPSFSGLSSLQELYLSGNAFTSISSDFLSVGLTSLQSVRIDDNPFSPWALSDGRLAGATSLNAFSASNASINGSIPDFFGTMPSLQSLRLSYNNLGGSLPSTFSVSSIQNLWLNNQEGPQLSGRIDVLANMTQLIEVWLHVNNFSGPIPDLSNCISIKDLQLRDNSFTGLVPPSLTASLPILTNVSLSNNNLQGPFPSFRSGVTLDDLGKQNSFCLSKPGPCDTRVTVLLSVAGALGYPSKFADSWTGNNPCAGWLFVTCDSQRNSITVLNFASQQLVGTISPDIVNLTALQRLVLSNNNLIGSIPDSLATLPNLVLVDVQNNNLTGKIPAFRSNVVLKTDGNPFLGTDTPAPGGDGGSPGSVPGSNVTSPPGSESSPGIASTSSFSTGAIVGIVLAAVFICMGCVWICWFRIKKRRQKHGIIQSPDQTHKQQQMGKIGGGSNANGGIFASTSNQHSRTSSGVPEMKVVEGGPNMMISIHELREVTDDFSQDNVLGRGGFGVVYRGEYQDGRKIAVKRMEAGAMGTKGLGEFQAEIAVLTKVRHRHLVALLGYCMEGNERLLVYEYMPQGTLGQHLFDPIENGCSVLTWKQRLTIALDVARGVEYLHSLAHTSFIHRDLKPSNVLLGDNMRAKVSDFGLVKNAPDGKYSVETRLAGTFGYLAPEYCATGRVTTKVDVYAFGVILMELITGRRALEESQPEERRHLVTWFRRVLINKDNIGKAIDTSLNVESEDDQETMSSICAVAELAGHCTAREPYQRPDLGHAVNVLSPLVEQWKPTSREEEDALDLNMNLPQALLRWQANEGSSMTMPTNGFYLGGGSRSLENTQSSLPTKPAGFADSFNSMDCR